MLTSLGPYLKSHANPDSNWRTRQSPAFIASVRCIPCAFTSYSWTKPSTEQLRRYIRSCFLCILHTHDHWRLFRYRTAKRLRSPRLWMLWRLLRSESSQACNCPKFSPNQGRSRWIRYSLTMHWYVLRVQCSNFSQTAIWRLGGCRVRYDRDTIEVTYWIRVITLRLKTEYTTTRVVSSERTKWVNKPELNLRSAWLNLGQASHSYLQFGLSFSKAQW